MLTHRHFILNLAISLILLILTDIHYIFIMIFLVSSVLIDMDHYLYYIFEKKRFSLKSAHIWYLIEREKFHNLLLKEKKKHRYFIFIFHGIEPLILIFLLSYFYYPIFFIALGFFIHLIEDLTEAIRFNYFERKLFLSYAIYLHIKNKVR